MGVKQSIFGSKSEERGFRSIEHTWGESYRVIPQFPMSALFTPKPYCMCRSKSRQTETARRSSTLSFGMPNKMPFRTTSSHLRNLIIWGKTLS